MRSRSLLIALPLLAIAAPVAAQDVVFMPGTGDEPSYSSFNSEPRTYRDDDSDISDIADDIADPATQDGIATAVEQVTATMMRLPIGQFAEAIENARPGTVDQRIRRNATVGDLAGRDGEDLPERLGDGSRQVMGMMGGFARAMSVMMPEFERMGREMEESFRAAKAQAKRN